MKMVHLTSFFLFTSTPRREVMDENNAELSQFPVLSGHEDPGKLFRRMCVTQDLDLLKNLLFSLGIAMSTFTTSNGTEKGKLSEILLFYDNADGSISFGIKRENMTRAERTTFFPLIFRNLAKYFEGKVVLYLAFKALLGTAINLTYLGGITSLPPIGRETANGRWNIRLDHMARNVLLEARASSCFQEIGCFALQTNPATFSYEYYLPALLRMALGDANLVQFTRLFEMWRDLRAGTLSRTEESRSRLALASQFPPRYLFNPSGARLLQYLAFHCWSYFNGRL